MEVCSVYTYAATRMLTAAKAAVMWKWCDGGEQQAASYLSRSGRRPLMEAPHWQFVCLSSAANNTRVSSLCIDSKLVRPSSRGSAQPDLPVGRPIHL